MELVICIDNLSGTECTELIKAITQALEENDISNYQLYAGNTNQND